MVNSSQYLLIKLYYEDKSENVFKFNTQAYKNA